MTTERGTITSEISSLTGYPVPTGQPWYKYYKYKYSLI